MAQQTAVMKLLAWMDEHGYHIEYEMEQSFLDIEKDRIINAMLYALDEDGHTGDWKIKFVNDYYDKTFKS